MQTMTEQPPPLRIALLSYRSKPHVGGQGIYVRRLSAALLKLGHEVEVISGPPYPELVEGVRLTKLPSLMLWEGLEPKWRWREIRTPADVIEAAWTATGAFAEPLTFSLRAWWHLRGRVADFDVFHDNHSIGYGLLLLKKSATRVGAPVLASVHHPMQVDRRTELAGAQGWRAKLLVRRWYRFLPMGVRVARRLDSVIAVSEVARLDVITEMGLDPAKVEVVSLGAEHDVFSPGRVARADNLIVAVASADVVSKGVLPLIEALAKVRTEVDARLVIVSRPGAAITDAVARLGLAAAVEFRSGLSDGQLADLVGSATIAVVPSLYEGFSLPAAEAMASATPLVVTAVGALPEVVGPDGHAALHVPPGDSEAMALAILRLLADPGLRDRLGAAGRARVEAGLSWEGAARNAAAWYAGHRAALRGSRT